MIDRKADGSPRARRQKKPPFQATAEEVLQKAMDLLATRAHSQRELERKLASRRYPEKHIAAALEHCRAQGWLKDEDFARDFADELVRSGKYGPLRIVTKLQERGIDRDRAEAALQEVSGEVDWVERARALLERKATEGPLTLDERAKLTRFLLNRGFSHRDIRTALSDPGE